VTRSFDINPDKKDKNLPDIEGTFVKIRVASIARFDLIVRIFVTYQAQFTHRNSEREPGRNRCDVTGLSLASGGRPQLDCYHTRQLTVTSFRRRHQSRYLLVFRPSTVVATSIVANYQFKSGTRRTFTLVAFYRGSQARRIDVQWTGTLLQIVYILYLLNRARYSLGIFFVTQIHIHPHTVRSADSNRRRSSSLFSVAWRYSALLYRVGAHRQRVTQNLISHLPLRSSSPRSE